MEIIELSMPLIHPHIVLQLFVIVPVFIYHFQDTFNKIVSPHDILSFSEGELVSKVHVQNPVFDHVPPDLITLFISNM